MSDRFRTDKFDTEPELPDVPDVSRRYPLRQEFPEQPPLPWWIADRLLQPNETVTWVRGPKFNPSWERYITHPALFLIALAFAAVCLLTGRLMGGSWADMPIPLFLLPPALVLGSIFVLGISNGYFTRLVVTNTRLVILQGYEVCRSWSIDDLPRSLIRYGRRADGEEDRSSRSIDLESVKTMLGSASDQFVEAKTILAFSKQLERVRDQERRRFER